VILCKEILATTNIPPIHRQVQIPLAAESHFPAPADRQQTCSPRPAFAGVEMLEEFIGNARGYFSAVAPAQRVS
jgi:hypothetical protein